MIAIFLEKAESTKIINEEKLVRVENSALR